MPAGAGRVLRCRHLLIKFHNSAVTFAASIDVNMHSDEIFTGECNLTLGTMTESFLSDMCLDCNPNVEDTSRRTVAGLLFLASLTNN